MLSNRRCTCSSMKGACTGIKALRFSGSLRHPSNSPSNLSSSCHLDKYGKGLKSILGKGNSAKCSFIKPAQELINDSTAKSVCCCHLRSIAFASTASACKTLRSHCCDVCWTKWRTMCGWQESLACSSMGPWSCAMAPKLPPQKAAAHPSGCITPLRDPLGRNCSS